MVSITCASGVSSGPGPFFLTIGSGGAKTGDGASQGSNSAELALGGLKVAGATVFGGMAIRRRRAGAQA